MISHIYGATLFLFCAKIKTPTLTVTLPTDDESGRLDFLFANRITVDMSNNRFVLAYTSLMYGYFITDGVEKRMEYFFASTFYLCVA